MKEKREVIQVGEKASMSMLCDVQLRVNITSSEMKTGK
jgi:hypothetical protein